MKQTALFVTMSLCCAAANAAEPVIERMMITAPRFQQQWLQSAGAGWSQPTSGVTTDQFTDFLRGLPGLQADPRTTLAQDPRLTIRGFGSRSAFGSRGIEFLLDGVPLSTADGQLQLAGLMTDDIAQMEILRGPIASLYGNSAGGVIAAQSAELGRNVTTEFNTQLQLANDFHQQRFRLTTENWSGALQQSHYSGMRPHQAATRRAGTIRFQHQFDDDLQFDARIDGQSDPELQDPLALTLAEWRDNPAQTMANATLFDTRKATEQWSGHAGLRTSNTEIRVWRLNRAIEQFQAQSGSAITSSGGVVALQRQANGALIEQQIPWSEWLDNRNVQTELSLQIEQSLEHRLGFVNLNGVKGDRRRDERARVTTRELALRQQWHLNDAWLVFGGVRANRYHYDIKDQFVVTGNPDDSGSRSFQGYNRAVGTLWLVDAAQSLQWSYGTGFELPTLGDLAYRADGAGLNNQLKPATNQQWELVYRQQQTAWQAELAWYDIKTTDELAVLSSTAGRTVYFNAAKTRRIGVESALSYRHSAMDAKVAVTISRNHYTQQDKQHTRLPGLSERQAQLQIGYQFQPQWHASLLLTAQSKMPMDDKNSAYAPGRLTLDVRTSYQINPQWSLYGQISNLSNQPYVAAVIVNAQNLRGIEPGAERRVLAGIVGRIQLE